MATEKLRFKLELYATMWDKPPHAEILINDHVHFESDITGTEDKPDLIEFEHELEEGKEYSLVINSSKKSINQTVVNDKGDVLKDQLLNIKSIEIDEIDIGALVYEGVYTPTYPEPWATQQHEAGIELQKSFKNVTKMGHNGEWRFKFASPFYIWLLENLY
jgi:chaperonin GroEL (HSP60 family)